MIGTVTTVVGTAAVVALGTWSADKKVTMKFVVGTGIYAAALAILGEADARLASQFGLLVFVAAILAYGPKAAKTLGLTK